MSLDEAPPAKVARKSRWDTASSSAPLALGGAGAASTQRSNIGAMKGRSNALIEDMIAEEKAAAAGTSSSMYDSKFFDPSIVGARKKKALNFVSAGQFSRKADDMRANASVEAMLLEASRSSTKRRAAIAAVSSVGSLKDAPGTSVGSASSSTAVASSSATLERYLAEVPTVEWWDVPLLGAATDSGQLGSSFETGRFLGGISYLIEHPVPVMPPAEPPPPPPLPLPLTKRERKKLRTQRRLAAEKEKQDQIRCALLAPPPPKVKLANLMTVMKDETVADPSAVEARVRAEMAQRVKNHDDRNQARKLTPAERRAKKKRKLTNDPSSGGVAVSLYRIDHNPSAKTRFKIDINAQQNHLTGMLCLCEEINFLIVEGGPKAQKRYRKLLMKRIDWADDVLFDADDGAEGGGGAEDAVDQAGARGHTGEDACELVWEGLVVKAQFRVFRVESKSLEGARRLLKEKGCEQYLDMALCFGGDEDEDEDDESMDGEEENTEEEDSA